MHTLSNTWFLGSTRVSPSNGIWISLSVFAGLTIIINTETNTTERQGMCRNSQHLASAALIKVARTRLPSVGLIPELIPVLGSQPAGVVSHKPGGGLPLLSARKYRIISQLPSQPLRGLLPISLLDEQRHDGCEQFA